MHLFGLYLMWFGFLVLRFSCQLGADLSRTRRLCGRYLVKEIEKLCGTTNWSLFRLEEEAPFTELIPQASEKIEDFSNFQSPQTPFTDWKKVTSPASTSTSQGEATNNLKIPPLSDSQYIDDDDWSPENIREFFSSHDVNSYIHKSIKFQKKSKNKIKTLQSLFWGNHPQRKRRGFSHKCCLKGCRKDELAIACLPYIDFYNSDKRTITFD
ncbi:insulin-like peptide INSL6 [Sciurus carolinensis]|uniref:insulin-like peptide INSL6 n=1 Tax=Sciurus carolinensis TaxID=30640 RepID=UPI001FB2A49F|nr:insulin-like peptide INSL6 [Sciurus carolinensis]